MISLINPWIKYKDFLSLFPYSKVAFKNNHHVTFWMIVLTQYEIQFVGFVIFIIIIIKQD